MGSFSFTCCVSGLTISVGDPVRWFLLTENPYTDSLKCYTHDLWFPRTYPIQAFYNDYGSIEDWETGPLFDVILEGFQKDLIERPWGDNTCHDVPTKKDMSFPHLLEAAWEGRVRVKREVPLFDLEKTHRKIEREAGRESAPRGVPTRKRIEAVIEKAGLRLLGPEGRGNGFVVRTVRPGCLRVRWDGFGKEYGKDLEKFAELQEHLGDYASVAGGGKKDSQPELYIFPKPGTKDWHGSHRTKDRKPPLRVAQAMIREDVWQALVKLGAKHAGKIRTEIETAHEAELASRAALAEEDPIADLRKRFERLDRGRGVFGNVIPFTVGLGTYWELLLKKAPLDPKVIDAVVEFHAVQYALPAVRYMWRPSYSNGPQFGEWGEHVRYQKALLDVARAVRKKKREEMGA